MENEPHTPDNSRRNFIKRIAGLCSVVFLPSFPVSNLTKESMENKEVDVEKCMEEAKKLYVEYLSSEDYRKRVMVMFYRNEHYKRIKFDKTKTLKDVFYSMKKIEKKLKKWKKKDEFKKRAQEFIQNRIESVKKAKYMIADNIYANEETLAITVNLELYNNLLNSFSGIKNKKQKVNKLLKEYFPDEVINQLSKEDNEISIFIKSKCKNFPEITVISYFIHELTHLNDNDIPFLNKLGKTISHYIDDEYLKKPKEVLAHFQTLIIMLHKVGLIENCNNIKEETLTSIFKEYETLKQKKEHLKDDDLDKFLVLDYFAGTYQYLFQFYFHYYKTLEGELGTDKPNSDFLWLMNNSVYIDNKKKLHKNNNGISEYPFIEEEIFAFLG